MAALRTLRILPSARSSLVAFARASTATPFKAGDPAVHAQVPEYVSPKLESPGVGPHGEPIFQVQKRHRSGSPSLDFASCVGFDGTPLANEGRGVGENREGEDADDYRDYYEHHKPSPLSGFELADTRLPITRATDGERRDDLWGGEGTGYIIEDSVDEALERAEAMFEEARERGDPTMPHSRALLRKLRELQMKEKGT